MSTGQGGNRSSPSPRVLQRGGRGDDEIASIPVSLASNSGYHSNSQFNRSIGTASRGPHIN